MVGGNNGINTVVIGDIVAVVVEAIIGVVGGGGRG